MEPADASPRRRRRRIRPGSLIAAVAVPATIVVVLIAPAAPDGMALVGRMADAPATLLRPAPPAPAELAEGRQFGGTPAVGALFRVAGGGRLGAHFCTASVVDSRARDLAITAAHCVSSLRPGAVAFVPGYHDGEAPYGVWLTSRIVVDSQWARARDPNHDVAFLVLRRNASAERIEDVTGGERLGVGWPAGAQVRAIGYPNALERPIACDSLAHRPRHPALPPGQESGQMEFDCGGYTDGTSGGPLLAGVSAASGLGTVIGVIGGWEQGGTTPSVSYSPRFGEAVRALLRTAADDG